MRVRALLALAGLGALGGCFGGGSGSPPAASPGPARLADRRLCPAAPGFECARLAVALDPSGRTRGRLGLRVAVARNPRAPRGVLVVLTGGPGQPGVPFAARMARRLRPVLGSYRLVMLDQRGTGAGALRCPALQRAVGASDLAVPPPGAVPACARTIGPRRGFYTTAQTVADLDALRRALGARRLTLDGVSYGTFVAERYALAHPGRVRRLVLDSVVPHDDVDALQLDNMQAAARVLRAVCRARGCRSDPARDLAAEVRARRDGPALLDALVTLSVADPSFAGVPAALRQARAGRPAALDRLVASARRDDAVPAPVLSAGLHASTLCGDLRGPWGGAGAPVAGPRRPAPRRRRRPARAPVAVRPRHRHRQRDGPDVPALAAHRRPGAGAARARPAARPRAAAGRRARPLDAAGVGAPGGGPRPPRTADRGRRRRPLRSVARAGRRRPARGRAVPARSVTKL